MPSYTFGAKGAILLYDTTRELTLEKLEQWVKICRTHTKDMPILFGDTKTELVEQRCISAARARSLLEPLNFKTKVKSCDYSTCVFFSLIKF